MDLYRLHTVAGWNSCVRPQTGVEPTSSAPQQCVIDLSDASQPARQSRDLNLRNVEAIFIAPDFGSGSWEAAAKIPGTIFVSGMRVHCLQRAFVASGSSSTFGSGRACIDGFDHSAIPTIFSDGSTGDSHFVFVQSRPEAHAFVGRRV